MKIDIRTNVTPITVGDDVTFAILREPPETLITLYYSVHLSFNGGGTFPRTLEPNLSAFAPEFHWDGIDAIGTNLRVRVIAHRAAVNDVANSPVFSVRPLPPEVTDPHPDQDLSLGGAWTLRWTQEGPDPESYAISYRPNESQPFQVLRQDISGSARSASVMVPGPVTPDGLLRVEGRYAEFTPRRDDVAVDVVDGPVVEVRKPRAGAVWYLGESGRIEWVASGSISSFTVRLSRNSGSSWMTLASDLDGSKRQVVVGVDPPASQSCRVRVTAHGSGGQASDDSGTFRIRANPVDP
jgi:hypothetical protein